ncbi:MAG: VCBS repeat-containing protein, partial [Anaerolineae bacterium]|nr:VCBS repeat-containing protein [Anaerolineae bacterium]
NVSDIAVAISQELVEGGGTQIRLTGFPWPNDLAPGLSPVLTMTLPIGLNNVTTSARLVSKGFSLTPGTPGTPVAGTPANVYAWTFPPLTLNRLVQVTLSGLPTSIPADEVFLTVNFSYSEAGVARYTSETAPLLINRGGPETTITAPSEGSITSALSNSIRIQGIADDPEGVGSVEVCVTSATTCNAGDWQLAAVGSLYSLGWTFDWTPPSDGSYRAFARGVDAFDVPGPISAPVAFFVDSVPPSSASFDLNGTAYISTTVSPSSLAAFTVTGRIADAAGAYVSGVGAAQVNAVLTTPDGEEYLRGESVIASPGAPASTFYSTFSLPLTPPDGVASPYAQGLYQLSLSASDRAGNVRPNSQALAVIVDDTAPFTLLRVPQTVLQSSLDLGGRADDTVLSPRRLSQASYPVTQTLTTLDTAFDVYTPNGRAYAVGDLNGDTIDDIVVLTWEPGKPLEAGIFFGSTKGFPTTLDLTQPADVALYGETDYGPPYTYGPTVAINAPGLFDVNGDGIADLLIGDPNVALGEGRAYLLLGRRTWPRSIDLEDADWRLNVSRTIAFGGAVSSAGDTDGDGLSDILVGAATNGIGSEVLYLYLGRERGVPPVQSVLSGRECRAGCPSPRLPNLAGLGDADGDGLSDVLLAGDGRVWLIGGRPKDALPAAAPASDHAIATLQADGQQQTVAPAGDVNGDGLRDMLIGDPLARFSRVFVLFGRPPERPFAAPLSLVTGADLSFLEPGDASTYPPLGLGLAPMGDLDRDGKDDFAFGGAGPLGGVGVVLGGRIRWQRDQSPDLATYAILSSRASFEAGAYLSSGDTNGDAVRDVLLGMPGANAALLFNGKSPSLVPSGIGHVEVGLVGPITEPWKPITETLPTVWQAASLDNDGAAITTFSVPLAFAADGDYRIYARATDRAGNRLPLESWYVGTTFVNRNLEEIPTLAGALDAPTLFREGFLRVRMTGIVTGTAPIQSLRVFDGERWTRMPLLAESPGGWSNESNIARSDLRTITFRAVARDGLGNVAHIARTVTTDTLVAAPALLATLPTESWSTNITPTLVITWPTVVDLGSPVTRYASIDRTSDTVPTTLVGANQVSRALDAPGAWYAHVRIVDSSGNEQVVHDGPYGVNRTRTPSAILPDGTLDFYGAEYTEGMATGYDPYAAAKPALLLATWDTDWLYLGFIGSDWTPEERLVIYVDTKAGGSTASLGAA